MKHVIIIIPALNPTNRLVDYVNVLINKSQAKVIVVNDGSRDDLTPIFNELSAIEQCTVLTHEVNKGKGRALKTGFDYALEQGDIAGVVTADADGQHSVDDVCNLAKVLMSGQAGLVLGVREFSGSGIPLRSYIGNRLTSFIFRVLFGRKLGDTQTGLRGIARKELGQIVSLRGERFEYEMNMLIYVVKNNIKLHEVPIQTLYFNNNKSSHYQSFTDSWKILTHIISGLKRQKRRQK